MHHAEASRRAIASQLWVVQSIISRLLQSYISTLKRCRPCRRYNDSPLPGTVDVSSQLPSNAEEPLSMILLISSISKSPIIQLKEVGIQEHVAHTMPHLTPKHMAKTSYLGKGMEALDGCTVG